MLYRIKFILFCALILLLSSTLPQDKNTADEKSITSLIEKFSDADPYINGEAINEIVYYGEEAVNYLVESLQSENENVRWCSAIALGKIIPESKIAIPDLIKALEDDNENVKWSAVIALGNLGQYSKDALPFLVKLMNDEDEDIRWASFVAIKKIDPEFSFESPSFSRVVSVIDSLVPLTMNEFHIPGVSIALIENRKIVLLKNFGFNDSRTKFPVTDETIFEACSMSKPVFAYLFLRLAELGKIDLDKPLFNYLDETFYSEDSASYKLITARMILSHTSGLPNWRKGEEERNGPLPVYFEPGERFSYSGEGFFYLQRVVEKITGKSLEKLASEYLFISLGMEHSSYIWTEKIDSLLSCGHDTSGNFLTKSKYLHPNSAYTLYITAEDYAKFIVEILKTNTSEKDLVSKNFVEEMINPQVQVLVRNPIDRPGSALGLFVYWGLGWAIDLTASGKIIYHSGANRTGFRCYSQFNYEKGSGIVIMTNSLNGSEFWRKVIREIGDF